MIDKVTLKVLMTLGGARSSMHVMSIARQTGFKVKQIEEAMAPLVQTDLVKQFENPSEYFAYSEAVAEFIRNDA